MVKGGKEHGEGAKKTRRKNCHFEQEGRESMCACPRAGEGSIEEGNWRRDGGASDTEDLSQPPRIY